MGGRIRNLSSDANHGVVRVVSPSTFKAREGSSFVNKLLSSAKGRGDGGINKPCNSLSFARPRFGDTPTVRESSWSFRLRDESTSFT